MLSPRTRDFRFSNCEKFAGTVDLLRFELKSTVSKRLHFDIIGDSVPEIRFPVNTSVVIAVRFQTEFGSDPVKLWFGSDNVKTSALGWLVHEIPCQL